MGDREFDVLSFRLSHLGDEDPVSPVGACGSASG